MLLSFHFIMVLPGLLSILVTANLNFSLHIFICKNWTPVRKIVSDVKFHKILQLHMHTLETDYMALGLQALFHHAGKSCT